MFQNPCGSVVKSHIVEPNTRSYATTTAWVFKCKCSTGSNNLNLGQSIPHPAGAEACDRQRHSWHFDHALTNASYRPLEPRAKWRANAHDEAWRIAAFLNLKWLGCLRQTYYIHLSTEALETPNLHRIEPVRRLGGAALTVARQPGSPSRSLP